MIAVALWLALIWAAAAWWLSGQGLTTEPWSNEGVSGETGSRTPLSPAAARVGLSVFLAVVGLLFALLVSAYLMRMGGSDWRAPPAPEILWFNTATLIASSFALEYARAAASDSAIVALKRGLVAALILALTFLIGQLWAWRELNSLGYFAQSNPANAFFYLLTGIHGVHLAGGMAALVSAAEKARRHVAMSSMRRTVALCAAYWHFMLFVWIGIFLLLMGWGEQFAAICRKLIA